MVLLTLFLIGSQLVAKTVIAQDEEQLPYTGREYYAELKPFIVSGVNTRLSHGQRMHGYRIVFPYRDDDGDAARSRRDTAAAAKGPTKARAKHQGVDYDVYRHGKAIAYLGIPYAEKPIRQASDFSLAFRRPRPLNFTTASYLLNQTNSYYSETCPQNVLGIVSGSQDCLYMNVIAPAMTEGDPGFAVSYPVLVFFHGGSLREGGAYNFGPLGIVQNLVRRGMIVVTIQYRIGVYGFMNLKKVIPEIPNNSARGMYDQIEGLKWIQRNIGTFKGNARKVTLAGSGSGACCAALLYYASVTKEGERELNPPGAYPLFNRLILQSASSDTCRAGGIRSDIYNGTERTSTSEHSRVVCPGQGSDKKYLQCLEARTIHQLLANIDQVSWPIWDLELPDDYLRYASDAAYAASKYTGRKREPISVLMGMTRDEFASYDANLAKRFPEMSSDYEERLKQVLVYSGRNFSGTDASALIVQAVQLYRNGKTPANDSEWYDLYVDMLTDGLVATSILLDARRLTTLGNSVYLYKFFYAHGPFFQRPADYNKSTHEIVPHAVELPYIFMPERMWIGAKMGSQLATADIFGRVWYNFVNDGLVKEVSPRLYPGKIDLATGLIGEGIDTGYDVPFEYVFLNYSTIRVNAGDAKDAVFIRKGAEKLWYEWKYAQLTHYQPKGTSSAHIDSSHRSAQGNSADPAQLAKRHREERIQGIVADST